MKITEKVAFKIASVASYLYILSGKKLIKNLMSFWKIEASDQTVLPERSILKGQNLVENAIIQKLSQDF